MTRDPAKLADLAAKGVVIRARPISTTPVAGQGVRRRRPRADRLDRRVRGGGERLKQHEAAVAAAKAAGASRIALHLAAEAGDLGDLLRLRASRLGEGGEGERPRLHDLPQRLVSGEPVHVAAAGAEERASGSPRPATAASPMAPATTSPRRSPAAWPRTTAESATYTLTGPTALYHRRDRGAGIGDPRQADRGRAAHRRAARRRPDARHGLAGAGGRHGRVDRRQHARRSHRHGDR